MSDVATRAPRSTGAAPLWGVLDVGQRPATTRTCASASGRRWRWSTPWSWRASSTPALAIAADRPIVLAFSLGQIVAQLIVLTAFHLTGHIRAVVVAIIVIGMTTIASGVVTLGGMQESNGNIIFAIITPIGAVLLLGRRAAIPTFIAFVALVVWAALTDPLWREFATPVPEGMGLGLYAVNLILTCGIALALVVFIDGERVRAKVQSQALLLNVLPEAIVERLQGGEQVIADHCPEVTVLFSDVVDFTPFSERVEPERVVEVLDNLFSAFDALAERYDLEKIKTIGDAYMVVAGVPEPRTDHAEAMLEMALAMHRAADDAAAAGRQSAPDPHRHRLGAGGGRRDRPPQVQLRPVGRHGEHRLAHGVERHARLHPGHRGDLAAGQGPIPLAGPRGRGGQGQGPDDDLPPRPAAIDGSQLTSSGGFSGSN